MWNYFLDIIAFDMYMLGAIVLTLAMVSICIAIIISLYCCYIRLSFTKNRIAVLFNPGLVTSSTSNAGIQQTNQRRPAENPANQRRQFFADSSTRTSWCSTGSLPINHQWTIENNMFQNMPPPPPYGSTIHNGQIPAIRLQQSTPPPSYEIAVLSYDRPQQQPVDTVYCV